MHLLQTIGYEGSVIEDFIETLRQSGVSLLIDVRDFPGSRKKGFSKTRLALHLADAGIGYRHLKGLGDPKPGRDAARAGKMSEFRHIFSAHMETHSAVSDLSEAVELATTENACLLCFEQNHENCHRSIVAERMVEHAEIHLKHLDVVHGIAEHTQKPVPIADDNHTQSIW